MPTEREVIRKFLRENPDAAERLGELVEQGRIKSTESLKDDGEPLTVVGSHLGPAGIIGSKQYRCACGKPAWLSPSTQEVMAKHKGEVNVMCSQCLFDTMGQSDAKPQ